MGLSFELTEEQDMMRRMVRQFAEKEILPVCVELDEKEEFSVHLTRRMAELGLFGSIIAEEYGGKVVWTKVGSVVVVWRGW